MYGCLYVFFYAKYSANILRASVLRVGGGKVPPPAPTPPSGPDQSSNPRYATDSKYDPGSSTGLTNFTRFETLYVILLNIHKRLLKQRCSSHFARPKEKKNKLHIGLPTKKSKVLRFQICCTRTMYLSEIYKNRTIKVGAAKLFSVNSSRT